MKIRTGLIMFWLVAAGFVIVWPSSQLVEAKEEAQASQTTYYTFPLQGYHADRMCSFLNFNGDFTLQHFATQNGQLVAEGLTSGTVTNSCNQTIATITNQPQTLPINSVTGTCDTITFMTAQTTLQAFESIILPAQKLNLTSAQAGHKLCKVVKATATRHGSPQQQAAKLNRLLGLL